MGCVFNKSAVEPKVTQDKTKAQSQTLARTTLVRPSSHATIGTVTEDFLPIEPTSTSVRAFDNDSIRTFSASTRKTDLKSESGKVSITNVQIRPRSEVKSLGTNSESRSVLALDNNNIETLSASTRKTDTKSETGKVSVTNIIKRPRSEINSVGAKSDLTIEEIDSDLEDTYKTLRYVRNRKRPYSEYLHLMRKKTFVISNGHRVHPSSDTLQFMPSVDTDNRNA
ncbi:hypothetical protein ACJMK2_018293 [Sinanodonta woodiana]|uniref:Uncharacterized protein n=1 Tax=Sinanodonta woodiana TaxID=1069815 RepID=A0ABD3UG11_SINWO